MDGSRTVINIATIRKFFEEKVETRVLPTTLSGQAIQTWADSQIQTSLQCHSSRGVLPPKFHFLLPDPDNKNRTMECTVDITPFVENKKYLSYLLSFLPGFLADLGVVATVFGTEEEALLFSVETPSNQRVRMYSRSSHRLLQETHESRSSARTEEMFNFLVPRLSAVNGIQ